MDPGESQAIWLCLQLGADLLLIDERDGRQAAMERGIAITGTLGVLERAAAQNLIDLDEAFEQLKQTDFWVPATLLDTRLAEFKRNNPPQRG